MKARIDFPGQEGRLRHAFGRPLQALRADTLDQVAGVIAAAEAAARAGHWVIGHVAYEAAPAFDPSFRTKAPDPAQPLALFGVFAAAADGQAAVDAGGNFSCGAWRTLTDRSRVDAGIAAIRAGIAAGDYYQVNYTTRLRADFSGEPAALFEALRRTQPGGYCLCLEDDERAVLSVSPELFFDWRRDGTLTTQPMKGTAPRQADPVADATAARSLAETEKERAENLMIVDLLRNDLARVAVTGSVRVPQLFAVEALPTAWQMTSTVQCTTRPEVTLPDVFRALFPCGSVTGAPKVAAMAAIAALEDAPRGAYCGAIGLIRPGGHATFNVGIRSVVVDRRSGSAECGIGSGITLDSSADGEYAEWLVKRRFLLRASAGFELLETLRLEDGAYWLRQRHLERLSAAATHFGFILDAGRLDKALDDLARRHGRGVWRVRLLAGRDGSVHTEAFPLDPAATDLVASLAEAPVDGSDEFLRYKTTERSSYARHAPPAGVFDVLLWNERRELTEFTRGNLVVELDGRRVTPPVTCGLLPGVLRAELLAGGEISEAVVRLDDLARASGLWFANSVRGLLPVRLLPAVR